MSRKKNLDGSENSIDIAALSEKDGEDCAVSEEVPSQEQPCFVVGIGASAGGQEALEQIFTTLPPDCGISFVVIMHIPPTGPSFLAEMLGRYSIMPVVTIEEEMALLPNRVHVIPAGSSIVVSGGVLHLEEPEPYGARHPIDRFFVSIAKDSGTKAVAVLLSGSGTDGAKGARAIKEAGGTVIVQEPGSAMYPDMPRSVISAGAAEFVLPPDEVSGKITEIAGRTCPINPSACRVMSSDEELTAIFNLVKLRTGHDFSDYKTNTVMRRIERRMAVNEVSGIRKYVTLLEDNPQEAQALAQDILIGVTGFFRDTEAFAIIEREVIPRLLAGRNPDEPVRIWHACCATGEEVYSMAFLIREYLEREGSSAHVLMFATDIDETSIAQARAGLYPDGIESEVGEERLKAFFTRNGNRWQVVKRVREMIVFAHHSLIKNPPFSRLDLLVCRNFLIYLNSDMQKRLMALFHQVLKPGRFLFLGSSETVGRSDLFGVVDKKWKIFERLETKQRSDTIFPFMTPARYLPGAARTPRVADVLEKGPVAVAERLLMERYAPPCVIVNEKYEVVHVTSRLNRFLEVPVGEPSKDVLRMAREDLRPALRAAIHKAFAENRKVDFRGLKVGSEGLESVLNLQVEPLEAGHAASRLALVVFEPVSAPARAADPLEGEALMSGDETTREMLVRQLEEQLRITHEQLQATTEQLENSNEGFLSANEELISMNEEFQSANEELQSTNEELETSKEELQALNEELATVNAELQEKVEELNQANSDMENHLNSSEIATIFLDRQMNIKGFTPAVAGIFNLIPADIGRPFRHFAGKIDLPTFTRDMETVLAGQPFAEQEVLSLSDERCFLKRILPYRNHEGEIDGIVVTLIDITERKRMEDALKESEERVRRKLESIISPEGDIGNLDLSDIIDAPGLQSLVDDFYALTRMPMGLIDLKGKVLVGVGWQDICTKFHRVNPETCLNCLESDVQLSAGVPHGEYKIYKCRNNMWDVATPVMVGDRQFGNLFMGQFFFEDEPLDYEFFRSQAKQYGFDEKEYIAALEAAPRLSRETLNTSMSFFMKLADILSKLSYSNIKLARFLSERDALMESVRESEERFRNMFERHQAVMLLIEPESGAIIDANAAATGFYGRSRGELRGLKIQELNQLPPEEVAAERQRAVKEQRNHFVFPHRIATGEIRWVEVYSTPIESQGRTLLFSIIHDITERKRAEEALHESQKQNEFLAHILEVASQPFAVGYPDGSLGLANNAYEQLTGYSGDELRSADWATLLTPPEWREMEQQKMEELHRTGLPARYEKEYVRKDGSVVPVELLVHLASDAEGGPQYYYAFVTDITERKRSEEMIRRQSAIVQGINSIFEAALASSSEEELGEACLAVAEEITGSRFGFIGEIGEDGLLHDIALSNPGWELCNIYGKSGERRPPGNFHIHGVYGMVLTENSGFFTNDPASHPASIGAPEGHPPLTAFLGVPLRIDGRAMGMIAVGNRDGGYSDEELLALEALAPAIVEAFQRKKAEGEIRRSEERYRSLFNSLIEGFCIIEMLFDANERPIDYRFLEINPAFEAQTGLRNAQGKLMRELAPEHEAYWFEIYGNVALTGEPACFENEAKALNRWFNVCAYRIGEQGSRNVAILFSDITDARRAVEELRESRERLDLALASSRMATFDWDIVKNKRTWSDGVHNLLGTKPETFTGTAEEFFRIIHPEDRISVQANLDRAVETTGVYETEYRAIWSDGSIHHICARGKVHSDDAGRAVLLAGVCWDITERKRAEERLWAQARTLKALNSSSHALLHATDEMSLLQAVCRTVVEDCGHAMVWIGFAEEDDAKSVRPIASAGFEEGYLESLSITWADNERGRGPTGTAIRTGKPSGCADMLSDPAFEPWRDEAIKRGYASSLVLPLMGDGKAFGAISIYSAKPYAFSEDEMVLLMQLADELAYGISTLLLRAAHDQTYEELRQAKEEWELTFNSVPDLIAILNDRHQVVRVNKAMAERLGCEPAECVGMPCYEAIHGSSLPPEFCPHSMTMNDGGEHTVELHAERLEADYLVSTTPLLDLQGRMTGTVHVARDITERKRAEEDLRRAKEVAEASTIAKSRFLANMSHELRTPMSGVIGMLDLVLSGNLEAEQKEFIEIAQKSAGSLVRILNDILDLTKIEAGKFAIEEKPFSLRKCVEDTVSLLLPSALSKGLDLNFSVADDVPEILVADHLRLNQVLTNLVANAVKFTEKGQVEIRVTADIRADGKGEVTFTVADTGVGIPDGKKHLLFQVFSQVDDSHSRIYGGTGLGLAISKEIMERMGGKITFTSEVGKGSTFCCTIPLAETQAKCVDITPSSGIATIERDTGRAAETTKPRLLVAEDDPTIRQVLGLMLQRSNFEIDFAESGLEAVEIWEKGQFDLILMDVQMPGMNGFEATAVIREKERIRGGHTPIIAMTAHALKEDEERCLSAGMDSYISKPIDFKKSLQIIKDLIRKKGACS